jgi:hypothetical protein
MKIAPSLFFGILLVLFGNLVSCKNKQPVASSNETAADSVVEVVQPPKDTTENSIIVVMDGPRYSETWGDTSHQYIPHMFNDMAPFGVVYSNFRNRGETNTTSGAQHFSEQLVRVK